MSNAFQVDEMAAALCGWEPIETAPKDGTIVDLWHKDGFRLTDEWWLGDEEECWVSLFSDADVTHWMLSPTPPKPSL